jgi:undecaprenyl-diphosphatase
MDWQLYRHVDAFMSAHRTLAQAVNDLETSLVALVAVATFALWLLARPGGERRWKVASASALASAGLALLVNQAIARVWHRPRPYQSHPGVYHLTRSRDPSFPSDHASAAFAIALAVLLFDRATGLAFLAVAVVIAVGRVAIGAHYPSDVAAGLAVGAASALLVASLGRPLIELLVRFTERVTDPVLARFRRVVAGH